MNVTSIDVYAYIQNCLTPVRYLIFFSMLATFIPRNTFKSYDEKKQFIQQNFNMKCEIDIIYFSVYPASLLRTKKNNKTMIIECVSMIHV